MLSRLDSFAASRLEDTIIFALIERVQFALNKVGFSEARVTPK